MYQVKKSIKSQIFRFLVRFLPIYKVSEKNTYPLGVVTLVSHKHVDMCLYSLISFFHNAGEAFPVFIIDDGSLTAKDKVKLSKYFTCIIPTLEWCDAEMNKLTKKFEYFRRFRFSTESYIMRKKFDGLLLNPFERFLYLDVDILFYNKPTEILTWLKSKDKSALYSTHEWLESEGFDADYEILIRHLLREIFPSRKHAELYFSCGMLGFSDKKQIDLSFLNKMFKLFYSIGYANHYLAEEQALATLFGNLKKELLPPNRYLNFWLFSQYKNQFDRAAVSVHYAGGAKVKFERDAISLLFRILS